MDVREKLVELLKEISYDQKLGWYDLWGMREGAEDIADLLIAQGVTVSEGAPPAADEATERSAVVHKIEDKCKPEDFMGNRKPGQEWISVKDRLPERMQPVIVCREDKKVEQGYKDVGDWWKVYGTRTKRVTHWMPLPEPPKGD